MLVHYNGWGSRWDEWIALNSPRIAPFRSHTVQNPRANYLLPHPNISPDTTGLQIPPPSTEVTTVMNQILVLMGETTSAMRQYQHDQEEEKKENDLHTVYAAAQLAPIVDRMGRMLTDFAPHLNNIVKQHH